MPTKALVDISGLRDHAITARRAASGTVLVIVLTIISLSSAMAASASAKAAAEVKAAKGPVQITLRLQKTKVKANTSLWYKLELKNISKKRIQLYDRVFKDPYAIHVNSKLRHGIYLEIIDAKGKPLTVQSGNFHVRYDWEGPDGTDYMYSEREKKELSALQEQWKKSGMTTQQRSLAESAWINKLIENKNTAELTNPANKQWIAPGTSTATFAWADRGPGEYPGRSDDDRSLREGYTELWSYRLLRPGKYRMRAVYDHLQPESSSEYIKKYGTALDSGWIEFKTPFIEFEVRP